MSYQTQYNYKKISIDFEVTLNNINLFMVINTIIGTQNLNEFSLNTKNVLLVNNTIVGNSISIFI